MRADFPRFAFTMKDRSISAGPSVSMTMRDRPASMAPYR